MNAHATVAWFVPRASRSASFAARPALFAQATSPIPATDRLAIALLFLVSLAPPALLGWLCSG
jgi:hypothetical protein